MPFPHPSLLPGLSFAPDFSPSSPPEVQGVAVGSSPVVSAAPSSSGGGLLTFFPCSNMGSFPRETVLHELLPCVSFPGAAAVHKLLQRGSFPWVTVLQTQTAPVWVPSTRSPVLPASLLQRGLLSPWVHRSCQEPAPSWASHRVAASFRHLPALVWGPAWADELDLGQW